MGIAFDAASVIQQNSGSSLTWAHTCTGSDRLLVVGIKINSASDLVTGVTYNGVAMTRVALVVDASSETVYLYVLHAPAAGANSVVVSTSGSIAKDARSASYTGAKQTSTVDNSTTATATATAITTTLTPTADNCWTIAMFRNVAYNDATAGSGTTLRGIDGAQSSILGDSNGPIHPAASTSLSATWSTSVNAGAVMASFAPVLTDTGQMFAMF